MRILLFGDGNWAANSLRRLIREGHSVLGVVGRTNSSDSYLLDEAANSKIIVLQPQRINDEEFVRTVGSMNLDLGLSISYDQIFRLPLIETARFGFVNFHAGKLPFYRGRNVINWAIINGEEELGITAHYVDQGIDTGDIILQRSLPISWTDTYGDVLDRVVEAFPDLVTDAVSIISEGKTQPKSQSSLPGTYFSGREEGDEWLDWTDTSYNIHNKVRAITHPGPGARTLFGQRRVVIWQAYYEPTWPKYIATPGQVVGRQTGEGVYIKTGDSTLLVRQVQIDGQQARVPSWPLGTRLGINIHAILEDAKLRLSQLDRASASTEER